MLFDKGYIQDTILGWVEALKRVSSDGGLSYLEKNEMEVKMIEKAIFDPCSPHPILKMCVKI